MRAIPIPSTIRTTPSHTTQHTMLAGICMHHLSYSACGAVAARPTIASRKCLGATPKITMSQGLVCSAHTHTHTRIQIRVSPSPKFAVYDANNFCSHTAAHTHSLSRCAERRACVYRCRQITQLPIMYTHTHARPHIHTFLERHRH